MLGFSHPLDGKCHEAFIKSQSIPPAQIHGLVTLSNSTSSTTTKQDRKVDSNDVNPDPD
jgi:hypothetical protein